jgi:hypothetical protein
MTNTKNKLLIELLDMIGRKDKELYKKYCRFILTQINNLEIGCTRKILREILPKEDLKFSTLRCIFFPNKQYKTIEEIIKDAFTHSKVEKKNFNFFEIGMFIINFMLHLERRKKQKELSR